MRFRQIVHFFLMLVWSIPCFAQEDSSDFRLLSLEAIVKNVKQDQSIPVSNAVQIDGDAYSANFFNLSLTDPDWNYKIKSYQAKSHYYHLVYYYNCKRLWKPILKNLNALNQIAEASYELGEIDRTEKLRVQSFQSRCQNQYEEIQFNILHHSNELKFLLNSELDFFPIDDSLKINENIQLIEKNKTISQHLKRKLEITQDEMDFIRNRIEALVESNQFLALEIYRTSGLKYKKEDINLYEHLLNIKEAIDLQTQYLKIIQEYNQKTAKYEFFHE